MTLRDMLLAYNYWVQLIPSCTFCNNYGTCDCIDVCGSWSAVGTDVYNVRMDNPTMMLDLKNFSRDFQKYLVVHQFGHALGLEHEHQRIDFWESIEKHIDEKKMQDDPSVGNYSTTEAFKRDWLKLERKTHREAIAKCNYDPQSIMHWW